ncbi:hypothetical protein ACHAXA_001692 [Cyclostephanos tholiformis]|uniref:Uncharacterized protein n=1 Tax=Cyclostephanos tholiformis TaxID=382380 RepID=A0ABD3RSE9_9STRA
MEASPEDAEGRDDCGSDHSERELSQFNSSTYFDDGWLECEESESTIHFLTGSSSYSGSSDSFIGFLFSSPPTGPRKSKTNFDENSLQSKSRGSINGSELDFISCYDKQSKEDEHFDNVVPFFGEGAEPGEVDETDAIEGDVKDLKVTMSVHSQPNEVGITSRKSFPTILAENEKRVDVENAMIGNAIVSVPFPPRAEKTDESGSKLSKMAQWSGSKRFKKVKSVDAKKEHGAPCFLSPFVPSPRAEIPNFDGVEEHNIAIAKGSHIAIDDGTKDDGPIVDKKIVSHISVDGGTKDVGPVVDEEIFTFTASRGSADSTVRPPLGTAASAVCSSTGRNVESTVDVVDELLKAADDVTLLEENQDDNFETVLNVHQRSGWQVEVLWSTSKSEFLNEREFTFIQTPVVLPEDADGPDCRRSDRIDATLSPPSIEATVPCTILASAGSDVGKSKEFHVETGGDTANELFKAAADIADSAADLCGCMDYDRSVGEYLNWKHEESAIRTKRRNDKNLCRSINIESCGSEDAVRAPPRRQRYLDGETSVIIEEKEEVSAIQDEQQVKSPKSLVAHFLPGVFMKRKKFDLERDNARYQNVQEDRGVRSEKMAIRMKRHKKQRKVLDLKKGNANDQNVDEYRDVKREKMAIRTKSRNDKNLCRSINSESCGIAVMAKSEETWYLGGDVTREEKEDVSAIKVEQPVKSPKSLAAHFLPGIFKKRKKFYLQNGNASDVIDEDILMTYIFNAIKLEQEKQNDLSCQSENDLSDGFLDLINDVIAEEVAFVLH